MKKIISIAILACITVALYSQPKGNLTYLKLLVINEQIQGNDDLWSGSWYILKNAEIKERVFENKQDFFKLN